MAEQSTPIKVREDEGITCVQFRDKTLLDELHIMDIQKQLLDLASAKPRPLMLVDFHNIDHLGSACIGMLSALNRKIKESNGHLRLANIQPKLMQIFTLTKMDKVLKISSTRTGAMSILTRLAKEGSMDSP